jgi:hypothetical protein
VSYYERLISEDTGTTDAPTIAAVEEEMRARFSTLDHLSRVEFRREARKAKRVVDINGVAMYAPAFWGLP